jgi:suppressor of tumorigenicity protein 13
MPEEKPDDQLMTPDTDAPLPMGDRTKEVSEAEMDEANEIKARAIAAQNEGRDAEATELFTQAIQKNPKVAILWASRANLLLKLRKPNAAVRDCSVAIELNPDSAKAWKVRGRARRFLGQYADAKRDLQTGNRLDFDEGSFEVQKWLEDRLRASEEREKLIAARKRQKELEQREKDREEAMKRRQQA